MNKNSLGCSSESLLRVNVIRVRDMSGYISARKHTIMSLVFSFFLVAQHPVSQLSTLKQDNETLPVVAVVSVPKTGVPKTLVLEIVPIIIMSSLLDDSIVHY